MGVVFVDYVLSCGNVVDLVEFFWGFMGCDLDLVVLLKWCGLVVV